MNFRGSVDSLDAEGASGWIFDAGQGRAVVVQALLDGRIIGEAVAELPRPDLAAAGIGDGRCGFRVPFYEPLDASLLPFVVVRPEGADLELPRTTLSGFGDFFRALHRRFPGAGRHRSVFGGLWIDRTDAARLLAGRIASGATPADLAAVLRPLAREGHVLLRSALAPIGIGPAEREALLTLPANRPLDAAEEPARRVLEALPGVLFRDGPLRALRAALDDNPLAYRIVPIRGVQAAFAQPSAAEALPSPGECLAMVLSVGDAPLAVDVIRESHELPEFSPDGRSRWLPTGGGAGIELAATHGLSIEEIGITPTDLLLVGAGTLHRLRVPEGSVGLAVFCAPQRVSPIRFLTGAGTFAVHHHSGATLRV